MITPQYILPWADELVIDLFAGGGGASAGIEQAIGRFVDIAINHDPEAVAMHQANHPQTLHLTSDVFEVDPRAVTAGKPVGLLWASPDCTFHSKARGGKPFRDRNRARRRRGLAWVVCRWAAEARPRVICLENVEEFQWWGPLLDDGSPCPERKGSTFRRWVKQLENLGYRVEWRELRACDYGAPTIRKRLFIVARCDEEPIVWPNQTHGKKGSPQVRQRQLKPWRTAAECIDWSVPCPSIFSRKKPLADATCRRIAKGIMRYVVEAAEPFIVGAGWPSYSGHPVGATGRSPLQTRNHRHLVVPTLIEIGYGERAGQAPRVPGLDKPLGTVVAGGRKHALVAAFLAKHYTGVVGSDLRDPLGTVTSVDHHTLMAVNMTRFFGKSIGSGLADPVGTVTAGGGGKTGLVTSHLIKLRGTTTGQPVTEPLHTISAQGLHFAEVRAFLIKYYGAEKSGLPVGEPLHTIPTHDRFGLVTVHGVDYAIVDIGLRMLTPRELYRAQGFPDSYIIDRGADGRPMTKTAQIRMVGNSVCPPAAQAIVAVNYHDRIRQREAA